MAREKFSTLTEQMFYILLCLREECCGMDVMTRVNELTGGRVAVGPGTLYNLSLIHIFGAHTGCGTLGLFFVGTER